jgi:hypothetical protein
VRLRGQRSTAREDFSSPSAAAAPYGDPQIPLYFDKLPKLRASRLLPEKPSRGLPDETRLLNRASH